MDESERPEGQPAAQSQAWTLWGFAEVICPSLCRVVKRCAKEESSLGCTMNSFVEARVRRYPNMPEWVQTNYALRETEVQKTYLRCIQNDLFYRKIPDYVQRALASGRYEVTCDGPNGERIVLPQEIVGELDIDFHGYALVGGSKRFAEVRVRPKPETDRAPASSQSAASGAATRELLQRKHSRADASLNRSEPAGVRWSLCNGTFG
jgi:hypothetical protein